MSVCVYKWMVIHGSSIGKLDLTPAQKYQYQMHDFIHLSVLAICPTVVLAFSCVYGT